MRPLNPGDPLIRLNRVIQLGAVGMALLCLPCTLAADSNTVTITTDAPLNFGSLISSPAAGTETVSSAGAVATTGGTIAFGNSAAPASFTISLDEGKTDYSILLPSSATLTGTGASMRVDAFESTPPSGGRIKAKKGPQTMTVGATLHVGANQAAGSYSGTFTITVTGD
jgi:hypothetical protein